MFPLLFLRFVLIVSPPFPQVRAESHDHRGAGGLHGAQGGARDQQAAGNEVNNNDEVNQFSVAIYDVFIFLEWLARLPFF